MQSIWQVCGDPVWPERKDFRSRYQNIFTGKISCLPSFWSREKLSLFLHDLCCTTKGNAPVFTSTRTAFAEDVLKPWCFIFVFPLEIHFHAHTFLKVKKSCYLIKLNTVRSGFYPCWNHIYFLQVSLKVGVVIRKSLGNTLCLVHLNASFHTPDRRI